MLDIPHNLEKREAGRLLVDGDTDAAAALVACAVFLGDDILDDDGQPMTENELRELLAPEHLELHEDTLGRVVGLLHAISGDEFLNDATHFKRLVSAIVEGDPFEYEDTDEEPMVPDAYWALYVAGLMVEDNLLDELGPQVEAYLAWLADQEAEDSEALTKAIEKHGGTPEDLEPYVKRILIFRRTKLAADLRKMKCKAEWLEDLDPDLAASLVDLNRDSQDPEHSWTKLLRTGSAK